MSDSLGWSLACHGHNSATAGAMVVARAGAVLLLVFFSSAAAQQRSISRH